MARIRTIKPEFFTSLTVADLTLEQRLTFIGLWTHVDDEGRCVDDPRLIKAALWPLDDRTAADIADDLRALSEASLITRYMLKPKRFLAVTSWREHQKINRPTKSKLPAPEQGEPTPPEPPTSTNADSLSSHAQLSEPSRQERNRERNREGKGTLAGAASKADSTAMVPASDMAPTAQTLVAEWIDHCARKPPGKVIGHVASELKKLLAEGHDPHDVRRALVSWARKGLHPSTLPSELNAVMNAGGTVIHLPTGQQIPATGTDATVAGWLDLPTEGA